MSMKKYVALATLADCAVAWPALGGTKNAVERPFKCEATVTWTIDLRTMSSTGHHAGVATHTGLFTSDGTADWDLSDPTKPVILHGVGIATAANGDQLFWKMEPEPSMFVEWTGGTGRFKGAKGGWNTISYTVDAVTQDGPILTMTITYEGEGTLTY
jgi:hypothetical protein